jgi:hypothetical protein
MKAIAAYGAERFRIAPLAQSLFKAEARALEKVLIARRRREGFPVYNVSGIRSAAATCSVTR